MQQAKTFVRKSLRRIRALVSRLGPRISVAVPYQIRVSSSPALKDQVAIVTGGSGAIGRAVACCLAAEGAIVYVCGTTQSKIDAVVAEIKGLGGFAFAKQLDVSQEQNVVDAFAEIVAAHGRLDILVHSAGGSAREEHAAIVDQKMSVVDQVLGVNLRGGILCSREAARTMVKLKRGRIINIASVIGMQGRANFAEYAASKGGIIAFTKSIAMELGRSGITANCVSPGIVQRGDISAAEVKDLARTNWLDGYGRPEDIGEMVMYLVSDRAAFITGQNFVVDGGRSVGLKGD